MAIRQPDLTGPGFKADPYPFYARLRAEAPAYRIRWIFGLRVWIVSRYDDVVTVLKDDRLSKVYISSLPFTPRPIERLTRNLVNMDPPGHTRLRALVNKAFTPKVVEALRPRIESLCEELLDEAGPGPFDLVSAFALPVPLTVIGDLLGIPEGERRQFARWSKRVAQGDSGRILGALQAWVSMLRFGGYFRKLVARRREDPKEDLVTALIEAEEEGDRLSEDELISMLGLLLFAGYETTVNLIAVGALTLMRDREQLEVFRNDPSVLVSGVEELLRFTSPADFATPRKAREEIVFDDAVPIPPGALVLAALGSANRDERQFPDADRLDLRRNPNRHVAFGMGSHFCVGAPLARLEAQIALRALFRRHPALRRAVPATALRWRRGMIFRGLEELVVATG
ncbi:MAG TPA: cytochrome P450 [Thermoanaerobaculia bacterium]|nr:cytochrome P450 [Thermoanaerobaculia bacterium]